MTYHRAWNKINTTDVTNRAGTTYPSVAPKFDIGFSGARGTQSLVFCLVFCSSLFVLCPFPLGHCIVCPSIYGFWLPLWYIQARKVLSLKQILDLAFIPMARELTIVGKRLGFSNILYRQNDWFLLKNSLTYIPVVDVLELGQKLVKMYMLYIHLRLSYI